MTNAADIVAPEPTAESTPLRGWRAPRSTFACSAW